MNVGVIGYGAIGAMILERWPIGLPGIRLKGLLVKSSQIEVARRGASAHVLVTDDLSTFLAAQMDVVVEAAGHDAIACCGPDVLLRGCELQVLSVGALADDALRLGLEAAAACGGGRMVIPAGALAGFDGLLSFRQAGLTSVKYTAVKPVAAWRGTAAERICRLDDLSEAHTIFSGSAREAASTFPRNANLAAAVAIAGIGFDLTRVELIADPGAAGNLGRIEAVSDSGVLDVVLRGEALASNPRSSRITALSVIAMLQGRSAVIGFS